MRAFFLREEVQNHGVGGRLSRKASALRPASLLGNEHGGGTQEHPLRRVWIWVKQRKGSPGGVSRGQIPGVDACKQGPLPAHSCPWPCFLKVLRMLL